MLFVGMDQILAQKDDEVIRQLIADRRTSDFQDLDYFSRARYEKIQFALNDVDPFNLDKGLVKKFMKKPRWFSKMIERSGLNNKFVVPLMTDERVEQYYWRKQPKKGITEVLAINREGLNEIFGTGDVINAVMGKKYSDFYITDDILTVAGQSMVLPLGKGAMDFYDYDVTPLSDSTMSVTFSPKRTGQFALAGNMVVIRDSLWRVKYVSLALPVRSRKRLIDKLFVTQEYGPVLDGRWTLLRNDVLLELRPKGILGKVCYIKTQQYSHFSADSIEKKKFRGSNKLRYNPMAEYRNPFFWQDYDVSVAEKLTELHRQDSLQGIAKGSAQHYVKHTQSYAQRRINDILDYASALKGVGWLTYPVRAFINNYISLGNPEKFNIEPVTSLVSYNDIDHLRLRFGGNTTANLNRKFFFSGYLAYGFAQKKFYYRAKATYSFRKKYYSAEEFPRRNISIESQSDIAYLGERNDHVDHDDIFKSLHWDANSQMMFFNMQKISFERDAMNGVGMRFSVRREEDRATGGLVFRPMSETNNAKIIWSSVEPSAQGSMDNGSIRTTDLRFEILYSPENDRYYSSKQLLPVNMQLPSIGLAHTIGVKMLGGQYVYHLTELKVTKRWFLGTLGTGSSMLKAGAQWNTVPFPLLLAPSTNISYISDPESFNLISSSSFINDKYIQLLLSWETNGNLIGLVPIIKRMRWKEYLGVRVLWGWLSDKNNPKLSSNSDSEILMALPRDVHVMTSRIPYVEGVIGVHNIFRVLNVEYVARLTYRNMRNASNGGFRFTLHFDF